MVKKGTKRITLTFTEIVQIIIGKNGGGKSSLMRELSPLPPSNDDYGPDGYKFIVIESKKSLYELHSKTGSPSRHSFIMDGEELNESKTLNAQKILVKEHFGMNQEIFDLLLGMVHGVSFTTMAPAKRKEWIMAIYPNDMVFSAKLHNYYKTMHRDIKGGIKLTNKRLAELNAQKEQTSDPEQMAIELAKLQTARDRIGRLINENVDTTPYQQLIDNEYAGLTSTLEDFYSQVTRFSEQHTSRDDIVSKIEWCRSELKLLEYSYKTHLHELSELNKSSIYSTDNVEEERDRLTEQSKSLETSLEDITGRYLTLSKPLIDNPLMMVVNGLDDDLAFMFSTCANELIGLLHDIRTNPDRTVTVIQYDKVIGLKNSLEMSLESLRSQASKVTHRLKHIQNSDKTECPSCKFQWIPGVSKQELSDLTAEAEKLDSDIKSNEERLNKCTLYIETNQLWYESVKRFRLFVDKTSLLMPVFDWMYENDVLYEGAGSIAMLLPSIANVIGFKRDIGLMEYQLGQINNKLKLMSDDSIRWYKEKYSKHEKELSDVITKKDSISKRLSILESDLHVIDTATATVAKVVKARQSIQDNIGLRAKQIITLEANAEHHKLTNESKQLNAKLFSVKSLDGTIASTDMHLADMVESEKALDLLVRATSPTEGVVAEQLEGFIQHFVGNMNAILSEIWSTQMEIHPCTLESGELSFKFPVSFDDDDDKTKDISETSTGESQIINFVFRLTVMEYMGFTNYPLYLDEIGANFDERHRPNLMRYIKRISESGEYSQLFVVSHYIAQHGMLSNVEVCALSTEGVSLPEVYNKHVEIENG